MIHVNSKLIIIWIYLLILFISSPIFFIIRLPSLFRLVIFSRDKSQLVTVFITAFFATFFYIIGYKNISGFGISIFHGIYMALLSITVSIFVIELSKAGLINKFNLAVYWYLVFSFLYTLVLFPDLRQFRELKLLFDTEAGNSTNFINTLVMCCTLMYLIKNRGFYIYIIPVFILSFLWENRTGMLLISFLILIYYFDGKRLFFIFSLALILAFVLPFLFYKVDLTSYIPTRFNEEGLNSIRWLEQSVALQSILNLNYPFGGYTPLTDISPWIHNVFFDMYRVAGLFPAFTLLLLVMFAGWRSYKLSQESFRRVVTWAIGTSVAMTSVVFEGHIIEFIYFLIIVFNFYFIPEKNDRQFLSDRLTIKKI